MSAMHDRENERLDAMMAQSERAERSWRMLIRQSGGRGRLVDKWIAYDVDRALHHMNLNRWNFDDEAREALYDARLAVRRLQRALWKASARAGERR